MTEPTRRDFLKTTSAAAALGTGVLSSVSAKAFASGDDVVKIGLVGCGGRGKGAAAQALQSPGNVKLVAMGDAFRDQLDGALDNIERSVAKDETAIIEVPEENKFVGFDSFKKVMDSGIDVVILATPPGFRPMMFEYAVNKGLHVFMEKPVATDAAGVRQVLEAAKIAKEKDLKVGVGLQRHHQTVYRDFINRIHDGAVGDVRAMRVYWNGGGVWDPRRSREEVKSEMEYQMRNWYYYNWLCGDHINEQHIHNIDIGNWVMQKYPVSAIGMGGREVRTDPKYGEIFDHFAVQYTYDDGSVMFSECRHIRNVWNSVSEHIHGTKGIVNLNGSKPRNCSIDWFDGNSERFKGENPNPYQVEHDDLFAAIRNGESYSEAEYGAMSTMTAILGRMVTYSGDEITMEKALNEGPQIVPALADLGWDVAPPTVPDAEGRYPVPVPGVTDVFAAPGS
ncbi:Gfo/Idh/MocA family oxidoreductase [Thalassoglobus sp. JC818]|uniref:Gfo/Idh/MocA family protein n=1 Tax=Thalassoglobus sp. JC818 TaxID=3232136 RepID=UPI003459FD70